MTVGGYALAARGSVALWATAVSIHKPNHRSREKQMRITIEISIDKESAMDPGEGRDAMSLHNELRDHLLQGNTSAYVLTSLTALGLEILRSRNNGDVYTQHVIHHETRPIVNSVDVRVIDSVNGAEWPASVEEVQTMHQEEAEKDII
ncbi:hypothetical protein [Maritalea sp.]|uniref:hypothetical protein n=1 Tax=Maritalea sp. TaxID=2003361 RepID=UPI003EF6D5A2